MNHTDTNAVIETAYAMVSRVIVAHIRANPDQTEMQICYLAGVADVLEIALSSLTTLPAEQRPYIVLSREARVRGVQCLFAEAVEVGVIIRTGWSAGGSPVYRAA